MNLPVLQRLWQPDPQAKPKQRGGRKRQRQPNPDYPSKPELARQMLDLVAARFPGRRIGLVGDFKVKRRRPVRPQAATHRQARPGRQEWETATIFPC